MPIAYPTVLLSRFPLLERAARVVRLILVNRLFPREKRRTKLVNLWLDKPLNVIHETKPTVLARRTSQVQAVPSTITSRLPLKR